MALAVAVVALVDWRAVAGRLTLDLPLVVLALTYALAGRGPDVEVLGLSLSEPGLRAGLTMLAKATIGIVAVSALAASSSVPEIVDGLRRVGAPAWFRRLVALTARQLDVLRAEGARLRLAVAVRTGLGPADRGAGRRGPRPGRAVRPLDGAGRPPPAGGGAAGRARRGDGPYPGRDAGGRPSRATGSWRWRRRFSS